MKNGWRSPRLERLRVAFRSMFKLYLVAKICSFTLLQPSVAHGQAAAPAPPPAGAALTPATGAQDLAKKLVNPIADLVSVPFQFNWIEGIGSDKGLRNVLNIQPVVPFSLNEKWNLVGRWVMPYVSQPASFGASAGFSDIVASAFFSPRANRGLIWGLGPVVSLPSTSDPTLGSGKWSAGPAVALLTQQGSMTLGLHANHLWSFASASEENRPETSQTLLQPVLAHSSRTGVTWTLTSETTVNWSAENSQQWSVPVTLQVSKITRLGPFPFSVGGGGGAYVVKPDGGPDWQLRSVFTLILPQVAPGGGRPR